MTEKFDIAIIGAGIAGIGAAAILSDRHSIAILEAEDNPGYHASGRSAALYFESYGNAVVQRLNRLTAPFLYNPDLDTIDGDILSPRGVMTLAEPGDEEAFSSLLSLNTGLQHLKPIEAAEKFPILRPEKFVGAAYEASALDIDVDRLLQGWMKLARRNGAQVLTNARVNALNYENGRWQVFTEHKIIETAIVVNAAGAWADEIAILAGARPVGIQPYRRSIAVIKPGDHDVGSWPLICNLSETWYAKPQGQRLLVSPADEDPLPPMNAYVDDEVLAGGLHRYEQAVTEPVMRLEASWAGLRSFAPDRTPVNGFDPDLPGFFWLAGQGGYGFQTSYAMNTHAAALINGEPCPDPSLEQSLSPARLR